MFMQRCQGIVLRSLEWFDDPSNVAACAIVVSTILQSTTLFSLLAAGRTVWLGIGMHFG